MILVIFIKAVAELGVIPYTHVFYSKFLACHKTEDLYNSKCLSNCLVTVV